MVLVFLSQIPIKRTTPIDLAKRDAAREIAANEKAAVKSIAKYRKVNLKGRVASKKQARTPVPLARLSTLGFALDYL